MTFDLGNFSLVDMLQCGRGIRRAAAGAVSFEEAADAVIAYLYAELESHGAAATRPALVRFYKTRKFAELDPSLKAFALTQMGAATAPPDMRCLTLLATAGQEPEWCDPRRSVNHRTIPLPSEGVVEQAPMIARLIRELGMEISEVVSPDPALASERAGRTYDVFHIAEAAGSPFIPAQAEFVERYGIRSVVGFGGSLADGEFFAIILFARGAVPEHSAARFRNIALDIKATLHPFSLAVSSYREP